MDITDNHLQTNESACELKINVEYRQGEWPKKKWKETEKVAGGGCNKMRPINAERVILFVDVAACSAANNNNNLLSVVKKKNLPEIGGHIFCSH